MSSKEIKKDSVALLMPCSAGVDPKTLQSALALVSYSGQKGHQVLQVGITDRTLIDTARNILAKEFLKTECEWSFWMDSDMILDFKTIPYMIEQTQKLNTGFVTGVYVRRMGDHRPLLWRRKIVDEDNNVKCDYEKENDRWVTTDVIIHPNKKNSFRVDSCGFGCCLVHRSVYDKMEYPYFQAFWNDWKGKRIQVSEDFYFCTIAREKGIKLWALPELKCGHIGFAPVHYLKDCTLLNEPAFAVKEQEDEKCLKTV